MQAKGLQMYEASDNKCYVHKPSYCFFMYYIYMQTRNSLTLWKKFMKCSISVVYLFITVSSTKYHNY